VYVPQLIMSVGFSGPRLSPNHGYIRNIRNCLCYCVIRGIDSLDPKRHVLGLFVRKVKGIPIVGGLTDRTIDAHPQQIKTDGTNNKGE